MLLLGAWQTAAGIIYQNNTSSIYCYLPDRKKKHRGHKATPKAAAVAVSSDEGESLLVQYIHVVVVEVGVHLALVESAGANGYAVDPE